MTSNKQRRVPMKSRFHPSFESLSWTLLAFHHRLRLVCFLPPIFWSRRRHCKRNWRRKWPSWRRRAPINNAAPSNQSMTPMGPLTRPRRPPIGPEYWLYWKESGTLRRKAEKYQSTWKEWRGERLLSLRVRNNELLHVVAKCYWFVACDYTKVFYVGKWQAKKYSNCCQLNLTWG